jgi:hypothetical protein
MKRKVKISLIIISMIMFFSCGYETHVINTVHEDGSVTRKVTVKNSEKKFEQDEFRVPIDSTWQTEISLDINENNDTTWILTAEKHFANVEEINAAYKADSGSNRFLERSAEFSKKFKWFTTIFRFSETVERILSVSCPMSDFFTDEELKFIYLPDNVREDLKNGPDSIRIKEMADTIEVKSEQWMWTSFAMQWIEIFYDLFGDNPELRIDKEEMKSKVPSFIEQLGNEESDDLAQFFIPILGEEFYHTFEIEIDSSVSVLEDIAETVMSVNDYDMEIRMPGTIIASNGYADTDPDSAESGGILWTVKGEYFMTEQYEMWVESQVSNYWAWIITALFIIFVITGFVIRSKKEKD